MREIKFRACKFRAWDKKSKKMRRVDSIEFDKNGNIKLVNLWGRDCIEDKDIIVKRENGSFELQEYTRLKDKNGVEIYEGDIVRCWGGECRYGVWEYNEQIVIDDLIIDCYEMGHSEFLEVVGNIYEKAELLEGNNE